MRIFDSFICLVFEVEETMLIVVKSVYHLSYSMLDICVDTDPARSGVFVRPDIACCFYGMENSSFQAIAADPADTVV